MRQKALIVIVVTGIVALLIVLNALTIDTEERKRDSEWRPNRSTYHAGATGLRAFYDFLGESGYQVMRWREPIAQLFGPAGMQIQTFVLVGSTQLPVDDAEALDLLGWVATGHRLVIIDRSPANLLPKTKTWVLNTEPGDWSGAADPENVQAMTANVSPLRPVLPSLLTRNVVEVMPSKLASKIKISGLNQEAEAYADSDDYYSVKGASPAPVVYLGTLEGALLADYPYGAGRIILLSDPFIVANNGLELKDNLILALNLVTESDGLIAFDEYHQGHGVTRNAVIGYFAGTPVLAFSAQLGLLVVLFLWSRGRRFARPLPLPHIDRRSKLEFVASMAELQERSKAFDLAIENIYTSTRRVLARYAGVDYNTSRAEIAARVAARSTVDAQQLETLMRECEEAINGAPLNWRQSLGLVKRLREVERTLGLRTRVREQRHAAEPT